MIHSQSWTARQRLGHAPGAFAFAILALGAALPMARADDAKTQDVDAGGLTFQAPASWKQSPPQTSMRRAQFKIEPAKGDGDPAELVVFGFPGGAGTVDANVARWQEMFRDKDGNPPKVDVKTVKGKNLDVNRVEISGHYFPSQFPGQAKQPDKENYRLLGAIAITEKTGYFFRLVGPDKTVAALRDDFDKMITTIKKAEGK
jgi:hypothetical protein